MLNLINLQLQLMRACGRGDLETVVRLFEEGADPQYSDDDVS